MSDTGNILPVWAVAPGVPSRHVVNAALHAAAVLDAAGSPVADARMSYWHRATGGVFPDHDLRRGERLLVDIGLVEERDGLLVPKEELRELLTGTADDAVEVMVARAITVEQPAWLAETGVDPPDVLEEIVPDADRREALLLALGRTFDDASRKLLGGLAEEMVCDAAREELFHLGYADLARAVRRVSLESDQLGYDVSAPRIAGNRRLLEVKGTTRPSEVLQVHLSRNEAKTGGKFPEDWALVVCAVADVGTADGEILGWCSHSQVAPLLPEDGTSSRWEQALIALPVELLTPGLPRVA